MRFQVNFLRVMTAMIASGVGISGLQNNASAATVKMGVFTDGSATTGTIYASTPIGSGLGFFGWTLVGPTWAEGLTGITYDPTPGISLSVGIGGEQDKNPLRGTASIYLGANDFSLLSIYEYGGSGWWNRTIASWKALPWLSVASEYRRFKGVGPQAQITIPAGSQSIKVWVWTPFYDPEKSQQNLKLLVGTDLVF